MYKKRKEEEQKRKKKQAQDMIDTLEKQSMGLAKDSQSHDTDDAAAGIYLEQEHITNDMNGSQAGPLDTGFPKLDRAFGLLLPGMHVLGGPSRVGKTSFVLQLAAQVAEQGRNVIYIGFEPSEKNYSRCISQIMARQGVETADIKAFFRGPASEHTWSVLSQSNVLQCLHIYSLTKTSLTPETLWELLKKEIKDKLQDRPLVIVDPLEHVRPDQEMVHKDDAVAEAVLGIYRVCSDYQLPFLVTADAEVHYYYPDVSADFLAFPDSSQLMDIASSIFVLWPSCRDGMSVENTIAAMHYDYAEEPFEMKLVNLKNRNGPSPFSVWFDFYPQTGLFREQN